MSSGKFGQNRLQLVAKLLTFSSRIVVGLSHGAAPCTGGRQWITLGL